MIAKVVVLSANLCNLPILLIFKICVKISGKLRLKMNYVELTYFLKEILNPVFFFATFVVGYFQLRKMMREEVKHITDPIKEMLQAHNKRFELIDARIDREKQDSDRKWEAMNAKYDAKWDAVNQRLDNTYNIIVEEIRSRKQQG